FSLHLEDDASGGDRLQLSGAARIIVLDRGTIPKAAAVLESATPKACHDLKTHLRRFAGYGIKLAGVDFDTMLAGFLLNSGKPEPSLDDLHREYLLPLGKRVEVRSSAELAGALREPLLRKLEENGLARLFNEIEMPIASILAEMETAGIGVDADALRAISREFGEQMGRLEMECHRLAGHEFNLNSPIQLREILFAELKLSSKSLKKTKSGYSTDADTLEKLAAEHPLPRKLLEYRAISKIKSTYADALEALMDRTAGRVHTTFHQALTATGRLSSSDPNLQNIPTRSEEGRRIRRAFVAKPDYLLMSADYSQIELRVLAHLSGDATLVDAFTRGEDVHTRTAIEVLGVTADKLDAEARRLAKVINFGIIYGMGPQRLAGQLGISLSEASDYIKRYFERLPGVRAYLDETVRKAREDGYVTTMFGRRRYLPELKGPPGGARAQAERIAVNTPLQGTAADLIKLAMIRLHDRICREKMDCEILLQVHDELLLEVRHDAIKAAGEAARAEMEDVAKLRVPLRVELKWGLNWAELGTAA
ncbi:MAG TPA: DNA polymerase I, partial [Candidatus Binataceae bacterium]